MLYTVPCMNDRLMQFKVNLRLTHYADPILPLENLFGVRFLPAKSSTLLNN